MPRELNTDELYVPIGWVSSFTDDNLKVFSENRFRGGRAEFAFLADHLLQKIATNALTNQSIEIYLEQP